MTAHTADIALITPGPVLLRLQREPVIRATHFVQRPGIIDRDYDIGGRVKLTGMIAATAITLITAAIFLFL